MKYTTLGKTSLNISRLGFGGIPIQRTDAASTITLIELMAKEGMNFIDTARGYTVSEAYLGEALEGYRDKFVLATKSMARTKGTMAQDVETSLLNLRTNYIDLYQFHNPSLADLDQITAPGGALEALVEARAAGKIGHIGLTCHLIEVFEKAVELDWVETIMFPYNIVETQGEALMRKCTEKGIGFIVMKPMAGGAIEDPTLALRFILQNPDVTVVIPGMYTPEEVTINLAATNNDAPLSEEEIQKLAEIRAELGTNFCRRCNYCQPCTAGINISGVFLFQGYLERYGLEEWARGRYATLPVKASACVECGDCESRCPYNLPIQKMLKEAAVKFGE